MVRERYPGSERIPVVYVTCPPKGSPRKLAVELARFLSLPPIKSRYNVADIADSVCNILIQARTDLVLVDSWACDARRLRESVINALTARLAGRCRTPTETTRHRSGVPMAAMAPVKRPHQMGHRRA